MHAKQFLPIPSRTPELGELFYSQVSDPDPDTGCLYWNGPRFSTGYGLFYIPSGEKGKIGDRFRAHRVSYAWKYGDPGQLVIDHTCHNPLTCDMTEGCKHRGCVNPDHLSPTTRGENVRRGLPGSPLWHPKGNSGKTHCDHGHEFTEENTYIHETTGWRQCRTCKRAVQRKQMETRRDEILARRRERRVRVTYDMQACECCGTMYQPLRSDSRYCSERACINERQRLNRIRRLAG